MNTLNLHWDSLWELTCLGTLLFPSEAHNEPKHGQTPRPVINCITHFSSRDCTFRHVRKCFQMIWTSGACFIFYSLAISHRVEGVASHSPRRSSLMSSHPSASINEFPSFIHLGCGVCCFCSSFGRGRRPPYGLGSPCPKGNHRIASDLAVLASASQPGGLRGCFRARSASTPIFREPAKRGLAVALVSLEEAG